MSVLKKSHSEIKEACDSFEKDISKWKHDLENEKSERKQVSICFSAVYIWSWIQCDDTSFICLVINFFFISLIVNANTPES